MKVLPLLIVWAIGCHSGVGPRTADEARQLLNAAISAHGGAERLHQFDRFHLVSEGTFKGTVREQRIVDYAGPDHWTMTVQFQQVALHLGVDGERCWKAERYQVEPCDGPEERREVALMAVEHNAWILSALDPQTIEPAEGNSLPAIRSGDIELDFDAESHLLREIRHGSRVELLSEYREVSGVKVAGHRQVFLDGLLDLDERWHDILAGQADSAALTPPEPPAEGVVRDDVDPPRQIAWVEIESSLQDVSAAVDRMDTAIRQTGHNPSCSDGLIWTPPVDGDPNARWRLGVGIEGDSPVRVEEIDGVHFARCPAVHELGVYFAGPVSRLPELRPVLEQLAHERGLDPNELRLEGLSSRDVIAGEAKKMAMARLVPR